MKGASGRAPSWWQHRACTTEHRQERQPRGAVVQFRRERGWRVGLRGGVERVRDASAVMHPSHHGAASSRAFGTGCVSTVCVSTPAGIATPRPRCASQCSSGRTSSCRATDSWRESAQMPQKFAVSRMLLAGCLRRLAETVSTGSHIIQQWSHAHAGAQRFAQAQMALLQV